jgi:hypothetical protein
MRKGINWARQCTGSSLDRWAERSLIVFTRMFVAESLLKSRRMSSVSTNSRFGEKGTEKVAEKTAGM